MLDFVVGDRHNHLCSICLSRGHRLVSSHAPSGTRPPPGIIVNPAKVEKPAQNLVFCPPLREASGSFQYVPVGVVVASDVRRSPVLGPAKIMSYASRSFSDCDIYRYGAASR